MDDHRIDHETLQTEQLMLRRPIQADVDVIYRVHSDPAACAHNPADMLATRSEAESLYRRWDEHWQRHGFGYWVIRRRDAGRTREPLGFCGIKVMQFRGREVLNLLYRLDPSAWGDGVATEAATAVVGWATSHVPGQPVIARVRPANTASQRVAQRIGLHRAQHLDTEGEDGLDWIFVSSWPATSASPPDKQS